MKTLTTMTPLKIQEYDEPHVWMGPDREPYSHIPDPSEDELIFYEHMVVGLQIDDSCLNR